MATSALESLSIGDRLVRLVPSGLSLLFIVALLIAARFYDLFPVKPAPCGMRELTGIPCLACGGTRSMRALSQGEFQAALTFNPLVILGIAVVAGWFALSLARTLSSDPDTAFRRKISTRWIVVTCVLLALSNWIYLILTLPG